MWCQDNLKFLSLSDLEGGNAFRRNLQFSRRGMFTTENIEFEIFVYILVMPRA